MSRPSLYATFLLYVSVSLETVGPSLYAVAYRPVGPHQAEAAGRGLPTIYPQDVRDAPEDFTEALVIWPGILRGIELLPKTNTARLVLEHHYFDWKETHSAELARYFLSPRGEGCFSMDVPLPWSAEAGFTGRPVLGSLLVVYGTPVGIDTIDGTPVIRLRPVAANAIDAQLYSTHIASYERLGASQTTFRRPDTSDADWFGQVGARTDCEQLTSREEPLASAADVSRRREGRRG